MIGRLFVAMLLGAATTAAQPSTPSGEAELPLFSHKATLHPLPHLPALLSFVPADHGSITDVRALLVLDGQLLVAPLKEVQPAVFRATFPTPEASLSYRFQIVLRNGKSVLTPSYQAETRCHEKIYLPDGVANERIKRGLALQLREQRLKYIVEVLDKIVEERR